jgi:hypothetical protein
VLSQEQRDWIKADIKLFIRDFQLAEVSYRRDELRRSQKQRNQPLRRRKNFEEACPQLPQLVARIGNIQKEIAEIEILKAGKSWREKGEKSSDLLKRMATI